MPTTEEAFPPDTPQTDDATAEGASAPADSAPPSNSTPNLDDTLSPAVRRLVRQFDLDITGIHGTGPSGRIRVGDVVGLLGGRTDTGKRDAPARAPAMDPDEPPPVDDVGFESVATPVEAEATAEAAAAEPRAAAEPLVRTAVPTTTVFYCDMSRVLAHRRELRRTNVEVLTTSYFLTALAAALDTVPELAAGEAARFGVSLTTADGRVRTSVLEVPDTLPQSLDERVRAVDIALRANLNTPLEHSNLLVHHYGESGSLLATPTPIGEGHVASVGIGRLRREVVVRVVDGAETPRIAACCHVSLSFFVDRVPLQAANRALAAAVAILESWPE